MLIVDVETRLDFINFATAVPTRRIPPFCRPDYIEDESLRVRDYRPASPRPRLEKDLAAVRERSARPLRPPRRQRRNRLLKVAKLRITAAERGVRSIEVAEDKVILRRGAEDWLISGGRYPRLRSTKPSAKLDELIRLVRSWR